MLLPNSSLLRSSDDLISATLFPPVCRNKCRQTQTIPEQGSPPVLRKKKKKETDHVTPLFRYLYWLPISALNPVQHRLICYTYIHRSTPTHLSDYIQLYTHSRAGDDLQSPPPPTDRQPLASERFHSQAPPTGIPALSLRHTSTLPTFASEVIFCSWPIGVVVVVVVRYWLCI